MVDFKPKLSITALKTNVLNRSIKRQISQVDKNTWPNYSCQQEIHLNHINVNRLKVKGLKKIYHANVNQLKARLSILISKKVDFGAKRMIQDRERHYMIIKELIHEEDIAILIVYDQNVAKKRCEAKIDRTAKRNR